MNKNTVIISIMTDERGTVIRDNNDSSNRSNENDNEIENEERMIGGGATLPNTLTHSLTLSQIPSLTIINIHYHYNSHICNLDNLYFDDDR